MREPAPEKLVAKEKQAPLVFVSSVIANAATANVSSLRQLFESYQGMLIVTLRARGLAYDDIDDVCQEVWVKAWQHLQANRQLERPAGWLRRVAINLLYSQKRRRQQIPASQLGATASAEILTNLVELPSDETQLDVDDQRRAAVISCLDSLSTSDGEIVRRIYSGMKPRQIAVDLGLDVNALYTRKHRAMDRFKNCLEGKQVPG